MDSIFANCELCKKMSHDPHHYTCGHILCSSCTARIVLVNHLSTLSILDPLKIKCYCKNGSKNISLEDLHDICSKQKETTLPQQFIPGPSQKCVEHREKTTDLYCEDCKKMVCGLCTVKGSQHFDHNVQPVSEYSLKLINQITQGDISRRLNQIDCTVIKFKESINSQLVSTVVKYENLISKLKESKDIYVNKMQTLLKRTDLLFEIIKSFYSTLESEKNPTILDISFLEDFSQINDKLNKELEYQDESEQLLEDILENVNKLTNSLTEKNNDIQVFSSGQNYWRSMVTLAGHRYIVLSVIQLKDGRIASGSWDTTIKVWEVSEKNYTNTLTLTGHRHFVASLIQLNDGRIASASRDNTIKLWEVTEKDFKNTNTLTGHSSGVIVLLQLKDRRLASGSWDSTIKIWLERENTFLNVMTFTGHEGAVFTLTQIKDGRLVSGSWDKTIKIWDINDAMNTLTVTGHNDWVRSIIQLKDGRLISASNDSTIKVWEVKDNAVKNTITATEHKNFVCTLTKLKDGRIVSGSWDKTMKFWEVSQNEMRSTMTVTGNCSFHSVIQMRDGRLASGLDDNTVKIWG